MTAATAKELPTISNQPLVGVRAHDDLPGRDKQTIPILLFRQAPKFADAFITTIVGVGISAFFKAKHAEMKRS